MADGIGDLAADTAVEQAGDGRYTATLSRAWEIWGPMGGYTASVALRAVGAESPATRPASYFCQYHGVASFDAPVEVEVTTLKGGRTVAFHRARITQADRPILEATVCSVGDNVGDVALEHDDLPAPDVAGPDGLSSLEDLWARSEGPPFPFWLNFDGRPLQWRDDWPPPAALPPVWREWLRFKNSAAHPDPWVDACRALVLVDVQSWPAANGMHAWKQAPIYAPSLDLYVAFHRPPPWGEWLLCDGHSPFAQGGLMAWTGRLWSADRQLIASGGGQLICRQMRQ